MKEATQNGLQKSQELLNKAKQLQNDVKGTLNVHEGIILFFFSDNMHTSFLQTFHVKLSYWFTRSCKTLKLHSSSFFNFGLEAFAPLILTHRKTFTLENKHHHGLRENGRCFESEQPSNPNHISFSYLLHLLAFNGMWLFDQKKSLFSYLFIV